MSAKISRTVRRSGTKALVCTACVRGTQGKGGRNVGSFRGRTQRALNEHIERVHVHPRTVRPAVTP